MKKSDKQTDRRSISFHLYPFSMLPMLAACGSGTQPVESNSPLNKNSGSIVGLPSNFSSPSSIYSAPEEADRFYFFLQSELRDPYWVAALRSQSLKNINTSSDGSIFTYSYYFPTTTPDYYENTEYAGNWAPATAKMRQAYLEIFNDLSLIIKINFEPASELTRENVIVISSTDFDGSVVGFSYFPHNLDPLGSDIFIDIGHSSPQFIGNVTNYDYELLIHELGHALGLKHPFSADGINDVLLTTTEDNPKWTVMTYTEDVSKYDGSFRIFDLMALAEAYGVNPNYKPENNIYFFSKKEAIFILDGAGIDLISAEGTTAPVYIDLREGSRSFVGLEKELISDPGQIAISFGSIIENAVGGHGSDQLHGNNYGNYLSGGLGNDIIFAGEGEDTINGGSGADIIDLSELRQEIDTLQFELNPSQPGSDTVYGFCQGDGGDIIDIVGSIPGPLQKVVTSGYVPEVSLSNVTLRLSGEGIGSVDGLASALSGGGDFVNLSLRFNSSAYIITSNSQSTGEDQHFYYATNFGNELNLMLIATFQGNYLDIDNWDQSNFV